VERCADGAGRAVGLAPLCERPSVREGAVDVGVKVTTTPPGFTPAAANLLPIESPRSLLSLARARSPLGPEDGGLAAVLEPACHRIVKLADETVTVPPALDVMVTLSGIG
jgi:hypothetical protein